MNSILELHSHTRERSVEAVSGYWYKVQWAYSPVTEERLNVGVVFIDGAGKQHSKFLNSFERLNCLYSNFNMENFKFIIKSAGEAVSSGYRECPIETIMFTEPLQAYGDSVDQILNRLFEKVVPLGRPTIKKARQPSEFATNNLVDYIYEEIKKRKPFDSIKFLAPEPIMYRDNQGFEHSLRLHLSKPGYIGGIASTVYSSVQNAIFNLLEVANDIEFAASIQGRNSDKLALFVMSPSSNNCTLPKASIQQIGRKIDDIFFKLESKGIEVFADDNEGDIVGNIIDWGALAQ